VGNGRFGVGTGCRRLFRLGWGECYYRIPVYSGCGLSNAFLFPAALSTQRSALSAHNTLRDLFPSEGNKRQVSFPALLVGRAGAAVQSVN
jgi:hypothetical protein